MFLRVVTSLYPVSFTNRTDAGLRLAGKLSSEKQLEAIVIGLARGGVVVAHAVSHTLSVPLDVLVVKKIGSPGNSEFALGALAPDGVSIIHWRLVHSVGADQRYIQEQIRMLTGEIKQKIKAYRKKKKPLSVRDTIVILVDDGVATGATIEAAIRWLRKEKARKIILALPVAPADTIARIKPEVDELVVLEVPEHMSSVGESYKQFPQVTDQEVIQLLA